MTAFAIYESRGGHWIQTVRIHPAMTVDKARALYKSGWQVYITDDEGSRYGPDDFDKILFNT